MEKTNTFYTISNSFTSDHKTALGHERRLVTYFIRVELPFDISRQIIKNNLRVYGLSR